MNVRKKIAVASLLLPASLVVAGQPVPAEAAPSKLYCRGGGNNLYSVAVSYGKATLGGKPAPVKTGGSTIHATLWFKKSTKPYNQLAPGECAYADRRNITNTKLHWFHSLNGARDKLVVRMKGTRASGINGFVPRQSRYIQHKNVKALDAFLDSNNIIEFKAIAYGNHGQIGDVTAIRQIQVTGPPG